eukprot:m.31228 g.31228  ORF g.31228 m.31228 type:complete len:455 (+) comp6914_c0_seq1:4171-5535(+)
MADYDADRPDGERFATLALHYGQPLDKECRARAPPIYASSSFVFEDSDHGAALFALQKLGPIYTRIGNPTTHMLEHRIAKLEGSPCPLGDAHPCGLATSSGQAAQLQALLTICQAGDTIVSAGELYGGTYAQLKHTIPALGIKVKFVNVNDLAAISAAIDEDTKVFYCETTSNPSYSIPDFEAIAKICAEKKVAFVVDNTFGMCGFTCRPIKYGANVVVESCTKWIGGHGTTIGGVIVDGCNFDWGAKKADGSPKFPRLSTPSAAYHGMNFWETFGPDGPFKVNMAFIFHARVIALRDMGACQNPFGSFMLLQGLETLALRGRQHSENANAVAKFLNEHEKVSWVLHPSLPEHPSHAQAKKYFRADTYGAVLCFGVKGGFEAGKKFTDALKVASNLANVGDAKTLVIHPASTTHQQLGAEEQIEAGIKPDMIRLSVGIEDLADIIGDLKQALDA